MINSPIASSQKCNSRSVLRLADFSHSLAISLASDLNVAY
jgi:hypothetical protein